MQNSPAYYVKATLNRATWRVRRRWRWGRRGYVERPAGVLHGLAPEDAQEIARLCAAYEVCFETTFDADHAMSNYGLLQLLDVATTQCRWQVPSQPRVIDVGSLNFSYAAVLHAWLHPQKLVGIELDGYRLYDNLHTRHSYAQHYIRDLPATEYCVMNFLAYNAPADLITMLYPFVVPEPLVHWDLPLAEFQPAQIFAHAHQLLTPGGFVVMANFGAEEFQAAAPLMRRAGFALHGSCVYEGGLSEHQIPSYVSVWSRL